MDDWLFQCNRKAAGKWLVSPRIDIVSLCLMYYCTSFVVLVLVLVR